MSDKPHTIIVILDAKPAKKMELASELEIITQKSREEATCLEYRLHKNSENECQFILYENWVTESAHDKQYEKVYIKNLLAKLDELLAKPYQVYSCVERCHLSDNVSCT